MAPDLAITLSLTVEGTGKVGFEWARSRRNLVVVEVPLRPRYLSGIISFTPEQWRGHYGEHWGHLAACSHLTR